MKRTLMAAAAALAVMSAVPAFAAPVLPFLDDDYDKALSIARQQRLPIFIEAWAPW
jgi:hypothetical protein